MKNELSRITVDISASTHQKLKALAALKGVSMRRIIEELIELRLAAQPKKGECPYSHTPNKKTLKSIKEVEAKKGLKEYKDVEDLFNKLGI
jgi:antitoxin component of RelBE/YafQ-DinJ toxin-antitoxin module